MRSTLLQAIAGLLVVAGAAATWWQVPVNREGQITGRFTHAIEQLGGDKLEVQLGGIYALERIANNSPADRNTVQFILGAFVRSHAPRAVGSTHGPTDPTPVVDENLPWLVVRVPDVQTAMWVLGRRRPAREPEQLYLWRVDLRGVQLEDGRLLDTQFRHSNLARAWLPGTILDRSDLYDVDLRQANLAGASLIGASLERAQLAGANLHRANLCGADLLGANLNDAVLTDATADAHTTWPDGFEPEERRRRGVVEIRRGRTTSA